MEEAVKDSDIICVTSTAPVKEIDFPYIAEDWVKKVHSSVCHRLHGLMMIF